MASIETRNVTTSSFEARVIDLPTGYAKMLYWYLDGNSIFTTGVIPAESESNWEEIIELDSDTPLTPGTTYILKIEIKNLNGEKVDEVQREIITNAEEEDPEWSVTKEELGKLSDDTEATYWIDSYKVLRLKISFENNGTVTFSSKNAYGVYGFLSTSTSFDDKEGKPVSPLEWDYSSSRDFSFEDTVSSGTTYYLYVRHYYGDDNGDITIVIEPPSTRPDEFTWKDGTKEKQPRKPFDITAEEWGNLLDNINAVREYKGYSKIKSTSVPDQGITEFYYPKPNDPFYATNYNQCLYAFYKDIELLTMSEYAEYAVQPEDPITADAINFLVETINSVE